MKYQRMDETAGFRHAFMNSSTVHPLAKPPELVGVGFIDMLFLIV